MHCSKQFTPSPKEVNRGNGKFCSMKCSGAFNGLKRRTVKIPNCTCATCDKPFYRQESHKKNSKSGINFCSRECKEKAQRIGTDFSIEAIMPDHYGLVQKDYRRIAFSLVDVLSCIRCGYDKHVEALEVHHKDRDRSNNAPENLEILCANCHRVEHYKCDRKMVEDIGIEPIKAAVQELPANPSASPICSYIDNLHSHVKRNVDMMW
jgi:5-methylcytosine-specific restriction endonuclease McrA